MIINVSGYRCDALTVTASAAHLTPLTELTGADVFEAERALTVLVHAGMAVQTGPDQWRTTMMSSAAASACTTEEA